MLYKSKADEGEATGWVLQGEQEHFPHSQYPMSVPGLQAPVSVGLIGKFQPGLRIGSGFGRAPTSLKLPKISQFVVFSVH